LKEKHPKKSFKPQKMDKEKVAEQVFQVVAEAAPHIRSGLLHRREYVGEENPSNEKQMEADVWANELLKEQITNVEGVGELASEEGEEIIQCGEGLSVAMDPLDGSSNIPTNNLIGTIISVYDGELPTKGENMYEAFYVVYGPLISIMRTEGDQVNEYVLEEKSGDRVEPHLASEDIEIPEPYVYGFGGNKNWTESFRDFHDEISKELKLRYGGAMVGDVNQVLHQGGLFAYPARTDAPEGKLRLLFEANPVAYIFSKAGGASSNSEQSILSIEPDEVHERTPLFVGNEELIEKAEERL